MPLLIYHEMTECRSVGRIACEDCAKTGVLEVLEIMEPSSEAIDTSGFSR